MYTPYSKIETLYERNTERREDGLKPGALLPELKLKNPLYGAIKEWVWTEKIDGTNMRVEWTPGGPFFDGGVGCDRMADPELVVGGKSDKAQINGALMARMQSLFPVDKVKEVFPDKPVTFYGEGYGAGIQKIGGSYRTDKDFILFDIFMHDADNPMGGWWFSDENMRNVAGKLGIEAVPLVGVWSLEEAAEYVRKGFKSKIGIADAEGLVGRTVATLFDCRGHRLITKIKTVDFDPNVKYNAKPSVVQPFEN